MASLVLSMSRTMARTFGPHNVRVNAISPGAIATPIFWGGSQRADGLDAEDNARKMEKLKKNLAHAVPLQQTGLAEDIAYGALYLASDESAYSTGSEFIVDGGLNAL